jgi:hypothetical protein
MLLDHTQVVPNNQAKQTVGSESNTIDQKKPQCESKPEGAYQRQQRD